MLGFFGVAEDRHGHRDNMRRTIHSITLIGFQVLVAGQAHFKGPVGNDPVTLGRVDDSLIAKYLETIGGKASFDQFVNGLIRGLGGNMEIGFQTHSVSLVEVFS